MTYKISYVKSCMNKELKCNILIQDFQITYPLLSGDVDVT